MAEADTSSENSESAAPLDKELILELNFVPEWARRPPSAARYDSAAPARREAGFGRDRDANRGRQRTSRLDPRAGGPRSPRPGEPTRTARPGGVSPDRFRGGDRFSRDVRDRGGERGPGPESRVELPPLTVKFLPDQKALSSMVRQLHSSRRAYPLMQLASIFLTKPAICYAKVEVNRDAAEVNLFQCQECGSVMLDRDAMVSHIAKSHMTRFLDTEETVEEAPTGQFVCVARCKLSGILLGPPNHHSYSAKLQEVHRTRFPGLSLDDYRRHIEMCHDEALVAQWKEESRRQTLYRRKDAPAAENPPLTWTEAESYLVTQVAPSLISKTRRATIPLEAARQVEDQRLGRLIGESWSQEKRYPRAVAFALRAAFHHKRLHFFRVGGGIEFVTSVEPSALESEHVVDSIREVLTYLQQKPGCTREQLVAALRPGSAPDAPASAEVLSPLSWLIEKGHIIEFFDGTLSVPLRRNRDAQPAK